MSDAFKMKEEIESLAEDSVFSHYPELAKILLKDFTTGRNIRWATDGYTLMGTGYDQNDPISTKHVTGDSSGLIHPRAMKSAQTQQARTRKSAEVFTPIWIIKKQNDLIEEEIKDLDLVDYLGYRWLELTCGEAPYMVTPYDATSGEEVELFDRVGFVDRKMQRLSREVVEESEWLNLAKLAFQSSYGYEYQGDSLVLARENLLRTYIDYYKYQFGQNPELENLKEITTIIATNVIQLDGLKGTIPYTGQEEVVGYQMSLFGDEEEITSEADETPGQFKNWQTGEYVAYEEMKGRGGDRMKFDVVIGNPPYQVNDEGVRVDGTANASAKPIYHHFVESSTDISEIQCLIIPARWLSKSGKGLKKFAEDMLDKKSVQSMVYYTNPKDVFPDHDIKGGVCIYVNDESYEGKANITVHRDGETDTYSDYLNSGGIGIFIPYHQVVTTLEKIENVVNVRGGITYSQLSQQESLSA